MPLFLAVLIGKIILYLTRIFKIGGGSAAPGLYALKIDPNLVKKLSKQIPTQIVITGTNGKTTTSRLLAHFVQKQNLKVLRNSTGSNMARGIASALIQNIDFLSLKLDYDLAIWELDEASFNSVVFETKPQIIVFLNAFRDQLDRYGEVDTVVKKWEDTLDRIGWQPTVLANGSDKNVAHLSLHPNVKGELFAVTGATMLWERSSRKNIQKQPAFVASNLKNLGLEGTTFGLKYNSHSTKVTLPIPGVYHIFDFLAAFGVFYQLNLPTKEILGSLNDFLPAFGRVEKIELNKKSGYIFLIKNPAGATAVLETLAPEIKPEDTLLIALNDNFADGTDVSWIWDANFEKLQNSSLREPEGSSEPRTARAQSRDFNIVCSGKRAADFALRLKYAGFNTKNLKLEPDLAKALEMAQQASGGRVFILPTYTALLGLQKILASMGLKKHYWKEN